MRTFILFILAMQVMFVYGQSNVNNATSNKIHPRILNSENTREAFQNSLNNVTWKKDFVERKKQKLAEYLKLCEKDPQWLLSRLQMNWKTKHTDVYLKGGNFSHSDGKAPVPTVRYSGTRDWATDYKFPSLEEVEPYFDDTRGFFLEHKKSGKKEWVHPSKTGHIIEGINRKVLSIVEDAAFLYWLTGEEKYAKLAAPVFFTYIDGIHHRNPPVIMDESSQRFISGLATFEVIHEKAVIHLSLAYDYLYNYFIKNELNLSNTVSVFQKWGDQIIKFGVPNNNWNFFQARFLTYIALALDGDENYVNGKGQEHYLKYTFDISTQRQIAIKDALLVYDQETGVWPESPSYSMHVNTTLLEIMALLDNVTNANELDNYPIIEKAALACFQYLFPSGNTVGFGDSGHGSIPFENFELLISNYQKYSNKKQEYLMASLLQPSIQNGTYKRKAKNLFQLSFYVDELRKVNEKSRFETALTSPTFYAPNVSWFAQRMGSKDDAIMVSTVGSYGNHAHANGIAIELFANNYVHAPDMGKGRSYWSPDFLEYYSQMPAHNTVVVNGKSTYQSMRSYHPFTMNNHFPKSGELNPLFKPVSYSKVSFVEPETKSKQQRLTAIINTPSGSGYVLDLFRSKTSDTLQKHEYFYHNLGHSMQIFDSSDKPLKLDKTNELSSDNGQLKAYDYLSEKKKIDYSKDIKTKFVIEELNKPDNIMKLWIKGDKNQSIFTALSPKSNAITKSRGTAPKSLHGKEMPTLVLSRNQEAWSKPFAVIFNPYFENGHNPIQDVDFSSIPKSSVAQKIKVTHVDGVTTDNFVITTSENDVVSDERFYLKGVMSIIRKSNKNVPEFLFASGVYQLKYNEWEITAVNTPATVSIEKKDEGLWIHNDLPVVIKVPVTSDLKPVKIRLFNDDDSFIERNGNMNRTNTKQIEFRLEKQYRKSLIITEK